MLTKTRRAGCIEVMQPARALSGGWMVVLDADALERAQCLAHALDFLFTGFLLTQGLANVVAQFRQAVDAFAEPRLHRLDLHQGGFKWGLGFRFIRIGCC